MASKGPSISIERPPDRRKPNGVINLDIGVDLHLRLKQKALSLGITQATLIETLLDKGLETFEFKVTTNGK